MTTAQIIDLHRIRLPDGTPVSRALPSRQQRLVGAWCFLDHLKAPAGTGMQVEAHPHIGLQTFTWLLDGEIRHRDSTGSDQTVLPQQVGIMTAGNGISHTEHGSADKPLHAAQLWIALPEHARHRAPRVPPPSAAAAPRNRQSADHAAGRQPERPALAGSSTQPAGGRRSALHRRWRSAAAASASRPRTLRPR